ARLARPHLAIITAIAKAHIGNLGSIEDIAREKAAIMRGLEPGGVAVLPADSAHLDLLRAEAADARIVTFGTGTGLDARLISAEEDADSTGIVASIMGAAVRLHLPAPGRHMAMNAVAALAAAAVLGIPPKDAAAALEDFAPMVGRGVRRRIAVPGGSALLIDESYNGNAASMRAALGVLRLQPAARRIAVLGEMLELGDEGRAEHAGLAPEAAQSADLVFTCGSLMRGLYHSIAPPRRGAHAADAASLAPLVAGAVRPGDAVLVKGSLGSRMAMVISALDRMAETR
ncbi:MAG: Mur ligase family protein, partial [Pseudomonadota bacterium]|nr:Mur ligase family protein [Pseudomonadota bacterium]